MIPSPKLDDRTYADIVAEAMRLIPRYCPEWTDHNPTDPGITIVELMAWMTELILYRLNRVPEKNYLAFLNMIGIRLRSPQPARGLIRFELVEGADKQLVREGTQIASQQATDDDQLLLRLEDDRILVGRLRGRDLRALFDDLLLRALDEIERDQRPRRLRRTEANADHVQEREVILLGDAIEPIQDQLRHPRRQLENRDARIRRIVIGPVGAIARDEPHRLGDDVRVRAIVELGRGNHDSSLRRM